MPAAIPEVWETPGSALNTFWSKPNFPLAEELERLVPGLAGLCPLFEQNGEAVIGVLPTTGTFVRYYYEDGRRGDAAIEVLGSTYQQFAMQVLLMFEDAGLSADYHDLVAGLGFAAGDELRRVLDSDPYDDAAVEALRALLGTRP